MSRPGISIPLMARRSCASCDSSMTGAPRSSSSPIHRRTRLAHLVRSGSSMELLYDLVWPDEGHRGASEFPRRLAPSSQGYRLLTGGGAGARGGACSLSAVTGLTPLL